MVPGRSGRLLAYPGQVLGTIDTLIGLPAALRAALAGVAGFGAVLSAPGIARRLAERRSLRGRGYQRSPVLLMSPSDSKPSGEDERPSNRYPLGWLRMYALVFEFLAYLGVLGGLGWWLEQRYGWEPWGLFGGLLLGLTIGLYRMIREAKRIGL